jgi:predicted DNA-binding protein
MAVVSIRVSDEEKKTMLDFAKFHGETVSKLLRDTFFERLEDEYDVQVARDYLAEHTHVNHEWSDVKTELGFK